MTKKKKFRAAMTPIELRELRDAAELTQADAADRLGITSNHYSRLERGETPIIRTIAILARLVLSPHDASSNLQRQRPQRHE